LKYIEIQAKARKTCGFFHVFPKMFYVFPAASGENAYYFAHNRHFEIPEDAKIISGLGLKVKLQKSPKIIHR
jgi:hypothetical protein